MKLGPGVHHGAVLDHFWGLLMSCSQRNVFKDDEVQPLLTALLTDMRQDEGGPVTVLPEDHPPHPSPPDVGGVVLGPHEAVLQHLIAGAAHPVPIAPPGEDLDPADDVIRVVGLVPGGETDGVTGRVGEGDPLHGEVVGF